MRAAGAVLAASALAAGAARADDRAAALDAPAPPTLPALTHPTLVDTFEITIAGIDPGKGAGRAYAWFLHDEIEYPIVSRVFYVGAAHDVVAGAVPGVGKDFFFGAPEIWARGVWSSVVGLKSGGGLGVVLPAPRDLSSAQAVIFGTVRVVRPWDAAYFTDQTVTLRPWVDIGHMVGRFVLQLRQGVDVAIVARALHKDERRVDLAARTTFYAGFRVTRALGVGLEIWETYEITADLPTTGAPPSRSPPASASSSAASSRRSACSSPSRPRSRAPPRPTTPRASTSASRSTRAGDARRAGCYTGSRRRSSAWTSSA